MPLLDGFLPPYYQRCESKSRGFVVVDRWYERLESESTFVCVIRRSDLIWIDLEVADKKVRKITCDVPFLPGQ